MKLVKRIGVAAVLIAVLAAALYFGGWVLCALFTACLLYTSDAADDAFRV